MIGVIAEKPSQARNFAKAFFGSERTMQGRVGSDEVRIVALRGHLYELEPPDKQYQGADALLQWSLDTIPWDETKFGWKFGTRGDARSVITTVKAQLKGCTEIVIATDDDPGTHEGSGLACEVLLNAQITAPKYSRMYFVDESAKEVLKAYQHRKALPHDLTTWPEWKVAFFRNRWDYLAGLQETRVATIIGGGWDYVLRNGRLKSAMTVIVGDQLKAIAAYKKIPYFENRFRDDHGVVYTNPDEPKFKTKDEVPNTYHTSGVTVDSKTMKRSAPPRLMDLAAISAALAPKGINAKTVLATYQTGYEKFHFLSYPRTEDKTITPEQFDELKANVPAIARLLGINARLLTHTAARPTHVKPKGAHGANRPGPVVPTSLSECDQMGPGGREIYELVARSALAMFAEDYEYERQVGHVTDYLKFVGTANVPKADGWHAVLGGDLVDDDADANALGLGTRAEPFVHEGYPPKPQKPTMKWLMKQLEKRNVGTGATRTSTYSDVTQADSPRARKKGQLLIDKRGTISMAPAGELTYQLLPGTNIGSLDLTERVFAQMAAIEAGKLDPDAALAEIKDFVLADVAIMEKNAKAGGLTPAAPVVAAETVTGAFGGKQVTFKRLFSGHRFTDDEVARLLRGEVIEFEATSKGGRPYTAKGQLGYGTFKGHKTFGFQLDTSGWGGGSSSSGTKKGCPDAWSGHTFTAAEKKDLEDGLPVLAEFTWRSGKKSSCAVKLINGRIVAEFMDGYDKVSSKSGSNRTTKRTTRSRKK